LAGPRSKCFVKEEWQKNSGRAQGSNPIAPGSQWSTGSGFHQQLFRQKKYLKKKIVASFLNQIFAGKSSHETQNHANAQSLSLILIEDVSTPVVK
jgi:hypothetical protein